jgi:hypothetical protein
MTISFHLPVELFLVDPLGRRLGDGPAKKSSYDEIPHGSYEAGGLEDDETGLPEEHPQKVFSSATHTWAIQTHPTGWFGCWLPYN